jgi:cell division transport system permease protein
MEGIHRVREARKELRRVIAVADFVKYMGVLAVIVLLGTATFIISNAIRLTVYARRREIRIMQLVGATNWFIRIPLVVEGVVLGAVGGLIAAGLITGGRMYLGQVVTKMMLLFGSVTSGIGPGELVTAMVITGATIGALGSTVSIRKFLKN